MNLPVFRLLRFLSSLQPTTWAVWTGLFSWFLLSLFLTLKAVSPFLSEPWGHGSLCGLGPPVCGSLKVPPRSHLLPLWSLLSPSWWVPAGSGCQDWTSPKNKKLSWWSKYFTVFEGTYVINSFSLSWFRDLENIWVWRYSVQFSRSVVSDSLLPHGLQHARLPCPSPTPGVYPNHVHRGSDAIQPSHPLASPSPPALNLSQHHSLFQWVSSSHQVAKVLEFQLRHHSFQWSNGSFWPSFLLSHFCPLNPRDIYLLFLTLSHNY